jgi:hypothetical protein
MSLRSVCLEIRQRWVRRGPSGFALLVTLGIIGLLSLTVVALLSQTSVANNVTLAQRAEARTNRAAESAIETATNVLRTQTASQVAAVDDPCHALGGNNPDPKLTVRELDGVTVDVYCTDRPPAGVFPTLLNEGTDVGRTRLLGSRGGTPSRHYPTRNDSGSRLANWDTNCTTSPAPTDGGCFPWAAAIPALWASSGYGAAASQTNIDGTEPSLVHSGPGALQFGGDLEVKSGAVAVRNPADGAGPGINVGGQYRQGRLGLFNAAFGQPGNCGVLSPAWGTQSVTESWKARAPDVAINDLDSQPTCDDPDAKILGDQPGSGVTDAALPAPAVWNTSAFGRFSFRDAHDGDQIPNCSSVAEVQPGVYNKAAMDELNALIDSCSSPNVVRFTPGDYWFDTDLVVDNPQALVVFGTQLNPPTTEADFPRACDPGAAGVTITLRDRATIRHLAGRVAICNRNSGSETAIYQAPQTPTEWSPATAEVSKATSWTGVSGGDGTWTTDPSVARLASADGDQARWANSCSGSIVVDCRGRVGVASKLPTGAPSPTASLPSLNVKVRANSDDLRTGYDWLGRFNVNLANDLPGVRITATRPGGSAACVRHFLGVPNWTGGSQLTLHYDLLANGPNATETAAAANCRSLFATQGALEGATIRVDFLFRAQFVELNPINWFGASNRSYFLTIDQISVEAPWVADARDAANGAGAALIRDGGGVSRTYECPAVFNCNGTPEHYFWTSNFSQSTAGYLPSHGLPKTMGVEVTGSNRYANNPGTSFTRVRLDLPNGQNCQGQVGHLPSFGQTIYIELISADGSGPCSDNVDDVLDLSRATVTTTLRMSCKSDTFGRHCRRSFFGVGSITSDVDHVRVVATTKPYTDRRSPIQVTVDNASSGGASFWVDGDISVPRRDLEIEWAGPAYDEPLVRGDLVLNGLASVATSATSEVGTVCCTTVKPGQRYVTLHAVVNGDLEARSYVTISDLDSAGTGYAPGTDVTVRSFGLCNVDVPVAAPDDIDVLACEST